jgi:hypothetical protein
MVSQKWNGNYMEEAALAYVMFRLRISLDGLKEITRNLSYNNRCPGEDSSRKAS